MTGAGLNTILLEKIMRFIKPSYYDDFRCIAGSCPSSCCEGWQIVIDEESLEKYKNYKGDFGKRMQRSVSWQEGTFRQYEGKCAMLNGQGLCDLIIEKGEDALCDTCARYPRHVEEFENVREYSLSLSCPEAARIMLEEKEKASFSVKDTAEEEEFEEGFDFLLYTNLADAREVLFAILQRREVPFEKRKFFCTAFAGGLQEYLEEGDYSKMEDWIAAAEGCLEANPSDEKWMRAASRYSRVMEELSVLESMERLDPSWEDLLREERAFLLSCGEDRYGEICGRFRQLISGSRKEKWDRMLEKLAVFFIYTYFCGAVYDDAVHAKVCLAFFSTDWIQELLMLEWFVHNKTPDQHSFIRMSYRYAREIEHSDENLIALDNYFWAKTH